MDNVCSRESAWIKRFSCLPAPVRERRSTSHHPLQDTCRGSSERPQDSARRPDSQVPGRRAWMRFAISPAAPAATRSNARPPRIRSGTGIEEASSAATLPASPSLPSFPPPPVVVVVLVVAPEPPEPPPAEPPLPEPPLPEPPPLAGGTGVRSPTGFFGALLRA